MKSKRNKLDEVVHGVTEEEFKKHDRRYTKHSYTVHSRFAPGDEVHEVYFDEDIDAWNVDSWSVREVHACIDERGTTCSYISQPGFSDMQVPESKDLFDTSLDASNEAKKRNNKK